METRMPNGKLLSEEFESSAALFERFAELSAKGGKVERMHIPSERSRLLAEVRREYHEDKSKYAAHQGQREIARRLKRMQDAP